MRDPIRVVTWIAVATVALVTCRLLGFGVAATASKLLASSGFVWLGWAAGAGSSRYGALILTGLLFSWCGDLLLEGRADVFFLTGLVSFLLAHLAYITAFLGRGVARSWLVPAALPIGLASIAVLVWLAPAVPLDMVVPVFAYTAVISAMVVTAIGARGGGASTLIPAGALLFYISDLSVAAGQFLRPEFPNYTWGLPCYYAGQVLLALSIRSRPAQ